MSVIPTPLAIAQCASATSHKGGIVIAADSIQSTAAVSLIERSHIYIAVCYN